MVPHPQPKVTRGSLWFALLLTLAGAQLALFFFVAKELDQSSREQSSAFSRDAPVDRDFVPAIEAYRALPEMARLIPETENVLLLTDLPAPLAFDFYFLPRPLRCLQRVDRRVADRLTAAHFSAAHVDEFMRRFEERGIAYTPERLEENLRWADYVVTFLSTIPLPADGPATELVLQRGRVALSRKIDAGGG